MTLRFNRKQHMSLTTLIYYTQRSPIKVESDFHEDLEMHGHSWGETDVWRRHPSGERYELSSDMIALLIYFFYKECWQVSSFICLKHHKFRKRMQKKTSEMWQKLSSLLHRTPNCIASVRVQSIYIVIVRCSVSMFRWRIWTRWNGLHHKVI